MDFIQRNLINERNNLQIELAKAKILIAQLNEARKTEKVIVHGAERDEGEYMPNLQGSLASGKGAKRGRQVDVEPGRAIPGVPKQTQIHHAIELAGGDSDKNNIYGTGKPMKVRKSEILPTNEEAEYISGLENVIVALAESMNMSVEELVELNSPRSFAKLAAIARAVSPKNPTGLRRLGNGITPAENIANRVGEMLSAAGVPGARGVGPAGVSVRVRHSSDSSKDFKHWGDVGPDSPLEFDHSSVSQLERDHAENSVRRLSKAGIDQRAAAKEKASRTFESMNMSAEDLLNEKVSIKIPFTNKSIVYRSGTDTHAAIAHLDALHRRLWKDTDVGGERNHKVFDPNHHDPEIAEILNDRKDKIRRGQI
jgi:hypothetical protein